MTGLDCSNDIVAVKDRTFHNYNYLYFINLEKWRPLAGFRVISQVFAVNIKQTLAHSPRKSDRSKSPSSAPEPGSGFKRKGFLVLGFALVALSAGVSFRYRATARGSPAPQPGQAVLLITVDTLRADALGAYGRAGAATPWMDRLAAEGLRFEDAHAHSVVTLPSHASLLSGRYPNDHGVRDNAGFRFPPDVDTLATLLKAHGYATGAFVSGFPLASRFGLGRGFDVYDDRFVDSRSGHAFFEQERSGSETVALARQWLDTQHGRPVFCWVHLYEPHFPYAPPEPLATRFRDAPYQGEVAAADAALGPLLEPILTAGGSGRTLVALTADHGESLGEHGESTHGIFAYEATLRVPLILYFPGRLKPAVVSQPARHVDLLPTVLAALGLPVPADLPGHNLLAAGGAPAADATYFEALAGTLNRGWAPLYGLIQQRLKYVDLPLPELYDLAHDPHETRNLAASEPERLQAMRRALAVLRASERPISRTAEAAETRERLGSLGYVSGRAASESHYGEQDDPKRLIALDAALQEVVGRSLQGDREGALTRCRQLVAQRPNMALSWLFLAQLERDHGDLPAAIRALRKAAALNPDDGTTLALLGSSLTQAGQAQEAAEVLARPAARPDADLEVLTTRGLALARLGRREEALAMLAKAGQLDPANGMIQVQVGTVHLMSQDSARAREAFEAALALNPGLARAHSSLGVLAAEQGALEEAKSHWRQAVAIDPREADKALAVGLLLRQRGRPAEARACLEFFLSVAPPSQFQREINQVRTLLAGSGGAARPH
jgi:arylsulfatase A-like enzyme/Tfp pilus assembly protein PilF